MKKTIENLSKAFVGESMARNRYTMYAKTATKEGYHQIAELFEVTADNEHQHAKMLFRMMNDLKQQMGMPMAEFEITMGIDSPIGTTAKNLQFAIDGEQYENETMYPEFAQIALDEGLPQVAARLKAIGQAENHHKERYQKLLEVVKNDTAFKKEEETTWVCRKCGYVHTGKMAPAKCPSCDHENNYFMVKCEAY